VIPICLCLVAHEPYRLRPYNYFDVGRRHDYWDAEGMRRRLMTAERFVYEPTTTTLARLLDRYPAFALSLAISGPLLDQLVAFTPKLLPSFRSLVETGRVEPLCSTSHHCLSWAVSASQVEKQLRLQRERVWSALGREPAIFGGERPPDPHSLAAIAEAAGLTGMVLDGGPATPGGASRRHVYSALSPGHFPTVVATPGLSKDIPADVDILCLAVDLSSQGSRRQRDRATLPHLEAWLRAVLSRPEIQFLTPSQAFSRLPPTRSLPPNAAAERSSIANELQEDALERLVALEGRIQAAGALPMAEDFRRLTGSDHFAQMTLRATESAIREPDPETFDSPYEAYMSYRHVLSDLDRRLSLPDLQPALSAGSVPA
jgi:alpha-amylase